MTPEAGALDRLPVPVPGLLRSARCLAMADLGTVAGTVAWWARVCATGVPIVAPRAWQGRLCALLSYGVVCAREAVWRNASGIGGAVCGDVGGNAVLGELCEHTVRWVELAWPRCVALDGPGTWRVGQEWTDPSWMGLDEVHSRHRACLLQGEEREWYAALGWREQTRITGEIPADLSLPPSDPGKRMPRWAIEPRRDWPAAAV